MDKKHKTDNNSNLATKKQKTSTSLTKYAKDVTEVKQRKQPPLSITPKSASANTEQTKLATDVTHRKHTVYQPIISKKSSAVIMSLVDLCILVVIDNLEGKE
jgi:hypothetical protein